MGEKFLQKCHPLTEFSFHITVFTGIIMRTYLIIPKQLQNIHDVSGDKDLYETASPFMDIMGKVCTYVILHKSYSYLHAESNS